MSQKRKETEEDIERQPAAKKRDMHKFVSAMFYEPDQELLVVQSVDDTQEPMHSGYQRVPSPTQRLLHDVMMFQALELPDQDLLEAFQLGEDGTWGGLVTLESDSDCTIATASTPVQSDEETYQATLWLGLETADWGFIGEAEAPAPMELSV